MGTQNLLTQRIHISTVKIIGVIYSYTVAHSAKSQLHRHILTLVLMATWRSPGAPKNTRKKEDMLCTVMHFEIQIQIFIILLLVIFFNYLCKESIKSQPQFFLYIRLLRERDLELGAAQDRPKVR